MVDSSITSLNTLYVLFGVNLGLGIEQETTMPFWMFIGLGIVSGIFYIILCYNFVIKRIKRIIA